MAPSFPPLLKKLPTPWCLTFAPFPPSPTCPFPIRHGSSLSSYQASSLDESYHAWPDNPASGVGIKTHPVPSAWTCCLKISPFGREGSGTGPTFPPNCTTLCTTRLYSCKSVLSSLLSLRKLHCSLRLGNQCHRQ